MSALLKGDYHPSAHAIQVMTMRVSKGLEFPEVALPGVGHMPAQGENEKEAARVFYVAATRATHKLATTASGQSGFGSRLASASPSRKSHAAPRSYVESGEITTKLEWS